MFSTHYLSLYNFPLLLTRKLMNIPLQRMPRDVFVFAKQLIKTKGQSARIAPTGRQRTSKTDHIPSNNSMLGTDGINPPGRSRVRIGGKGPEKLVSALHRRARG